MTLPQLRKELTAWLKEAEPLDRPSQLQEPQHVAVTATKKLGLLGYGSGELSRQAYVVDSTQSCAAVLIDCLAALPPADAASGSSGAMKVPEVAELLGVSKETVYKLCDEGTMPHNRIGRRITISSQQLAEYQQLASY